MNLKFLLDKYAASPRILEIADGIILPTPQKIAVQGIAGSFKSFLFSALYANNKLHGYNHLLVLEDAEEAAYLHNDLEQLVAPIDLFISHLLSKQTKTLKSRAAAT